MNIFTAVKYCCILHGRVCVMALLVYKFYLIQKDFQRKTGVSQDTKVLHSTIFYNSVAFSAQYHCKSNYNSIALSQAIVQRDAIEI